MMELVFRSKRLVRAGFLVITIPALVVLAAVGCVAAAALLGWWGSFIIVPACTVITFAMWWVLRGLRVGMWTSATALVARGWVVDHEIARADIHHFASVEYSGRTVWFLAVEPFGLIGELAMVRVYLRGGSIVDLHSSFARPAISRVQVAALNAWVGES